MLVSSIGYLNPNKDFRPVTVKNRNSKDNSGFGHVQNTDSAAVTHKNPLMRIIESLVARFEKKSSDNNSLSLIA